MKFNKVLSYTLSLIISASLIIFSPASAFAGDAAEGEVMKSRMSSLFPNAELNANSASKVSNSAQLQSSTTLKSKFDLRDPNGDGDRSDSLVTNVKMQNPWGTCWGFSAIAACETAILSRAADAGQTIDNLDLSELQLADSVYLDGGAPEKYVGSAQAGEGYRNETGNPNYHLANGGQQVYAANIFASGIGPVAESRAPYKNKENEFACALNKDGTTTYRILTEEQIAQQKLEGATVDKAFYAGNYQLPTGENVYTDWTIDEDLWNVSTYEFENANTLPETRVMKVENKTEVYDTTNMDAVSEIKTEMQYHNRAVTVGYYHEETYLNTADWTYYCSKTPNSANHGLTIVGWDDSISADKFVSPDGSKPEGNGGWLIKNSWGSEDEEFPNGQAITKFGIEENGVHTGYFWLSYYDKSITTFESFDFDLQSTDLSDEFIIDQYDYMPVSYAPTLKFDEKVSSANIFTAKSDMCLRTVACSTYVPNCAVTYEVYLLDDQATSPTDPNHSKLVLTMDDLWHYAGYHRLTLPEENWIAMREGQRYSVVVSQKCMTDGKWYQGAGLNKAKPTELVITQYRQRAQVSVQIAHMLDWYKKYLAEYIKQGMDEQEAKQKAIVDAQARIQEADELEKIEKDVDASVEEFKQTYWVSKVNEGESFVKGSMDKWMSEDEGALASLSSTADYTTTEDGWADWNQLASATVTQGVACDNVAIKSYSEIESWATVAELTALQNAINNAKAALANDTISADGTDVYVDKMWMTQAQKDTLSPAVAPAEAVLALAGDDFANTLVNTTPTSEEVNAATATLQFKHNAGTKFATEQVLLPTSASLVDTSDVSHDLVYPLEFLLASSIFLAVVAFKKRELQK